jgi:ParB/RepB/Spo0J family partition protein
MADNVALIDPKKIKPNPENPRLIFHADELQGLEDSIKLQGVLVPLAVYQDGSKYVILDGERRWRCALKLGLPRLPAIVQPKPDRLTNIMMMFAIHNARRDWVPCRQRSSCNSSRRSSRADSVALRLKSSSPNSRRFDVAKSDASRTCLDSLSGTSTS